ncbi:MAG: acetoacetate decarboxylase family protein [Dehalococcoidia bacterium]|jgi:hypothetical protein
MAGKDFFDVPKMIANTSEGELELPIFYFDVSVRQLNFWVDYEKALPKLEGTGLEPIRFSNGKTIVSMVFYNYRRTSVSSYEELGLAITAQPQSPKNKTRRLITIFGIPMISGGISAYVLELPVTTDIARAGGREIWGYPKFVTNLPFKFSESGFEFGALDPASGESIVSVKADLSKGKGMNTRGFDLATYSNLNDWILKTIVNVDVKYKTYLKKPAEIKVGPAKHRMTDNLRDLGLDKTQPFVIQTTDSFCSRLNKGEPVAQWRTPPLPYPVNK